MKKGKLLVGSLIILSILFGSVTLAIAAPPTDPGPPAGKPPVTPGPPGDKGNPWDAIYKLQEKVAVLENQVADLISRVTDLENWKITMEDWKTWVNEKLATVQNELASLTDKITTEIARLDKKIDDLGTDLNSKIAALTTRVTDLENWKVTIENWKASIENWKISIENRIIALESEIEKLWAKVSSAQTEIATLVTRVTNLEDPTTLLAKIKQVDGSGSELDADLLDGLDSSELLSLWTDAEGYIYPKNVGTSFQITDTGNLYISGNVGIGTTEPEAKLDISAHTNQIGLNVLGYSGGPIARIRGAADLPVIMEISKASGRANNYAQINMGIDGSLMTLRSTTSGLGITGGNVGIGTTNPNVKLHVYESDLAKSGVLFNVATTSSGYYALNVQSGGTSRLYVRADGNVGIGTTTPEKLLTIKNPGADTAIRILNSTGGRLVDIGAWSTDKGVVRLFDSGTETVRIAAESGVHTYFNSGANVGIGTTGPTQKLDVVGYVKGRSGLCIGDDCKSSWSEVNPLTQCKICIQRGWWDAEGWRQCCGGGAKCPIDPAKKLCWGVHCYSMDEWSGWIIDDTDNGAGGCYTRIKIDCTPPYGD